MNCPNCLNDINQLVVRETESGDKFIFCPRCDKEINRSDIETYINGQDKIAYAFIGIVIILIGLVIFVL
jgi:phage FluMu protein Com